MSQSTFFGLIVEPSFQYKTLLKDVLLLTRAVIDPVAGPDQTARLILQIDSSRAPICQLDGRSVTTVPLNTQIFPGVDVVFAVAGDVPVHVSGFYEPQTAGGSAQIVPASAYELGSPDSV
jgi:hypothetical protein